MIDIATANSDVLLALGAGCAAGWSFATATIVLQVKGQLSREREMYDERLEKQEKRFTEQVAMYQEQLKICQSQLERN